MLRVCALVLLAAMALNPVGVGVAQDGPGRDDGSTIQVTDALILPRVGAGGRSPVHVDPLEAMLIDGSFESPQPGDKFQTWQGETVQWRKSSANDDGWFESKELVGGYLYATVESENTRTARLRARGHSVVYVNGVARGGDPYAYGYVSLPAQLRKGTNTLLFLVGRGRLMASLEEIEDKPSIRIHQHDATLPDLIDEQAGEYWASVVIENQRTTPVRIALLPVGASFGRVKTEATLPPTCATHVPFKIDYNGALKLGENNLVLLAHEVLEEGTEPVLKSSARQEFKIHVRTARQARRVTFRSRIDGSVQYYAVRPATPLPDQPGKPGIVLSLHGASVEAIGQARAYSPKSWCHIVCPTNRRPFGFDWEDWGRIDAMEVLEHAQSHLESDPSKVWLTGHSMGGHGTWSVGAHFPDRFAAIGPSAGWESFGSYVGVGGHAEKYSVSELLTRTANPSQTLLRKYNYKQQGIYILHGDADDNVPVREARDMFKTLGEFHNDIRYHEQPGAGHWWDAGHDEGADCVDWQPMFDMFARRRLPRASEVQYIDFTTVCPQHSSRCHWLSVQMQKDQLAPSRIQIRVDPNKRAFMGTTENITRFKIDLNDVIPAGASVKLRIDGQAIADVAWAENNHLYLRNTDGEWAIEERPSRDLKGSHRYGWFKNAFQRRFVYVYGTQGSDASTRANVDKARYDLETWGYRANGNFEIVADHEFTPGKYADQNVILIGNADTNNAWDRVLKDCPLRLESGRARLGDKVINGDDLAMLFVYPRADSDFASVGVIGGTGVKGVKLTTRIRQFVSGASFPDFILYGPEMLNQGTGGVQAAGYFSEDWSLASGEVVWNENSDDK